VGRREERVVPLFGACAREEETGRDEREGGRGVVEKEDCFRHAPSPPWTNPPYSSCFDRDGAGSPSILLSLSFPEDERIYTAEEQK
jgi:hypothetical protein